METPATTRLLVGTYTSRESEGIYAVPFDEEAGTFGRPQLAARTREPSYVAVHPGFRHVYAVNELWEFQGRPGGGVTAFSFEAATGLLEELNAEASHGADPCHLSFDASGRFLFVSNFTGGSIAVLPIRDGGTLEQASHVVEHKGRGAHPRRQAGPHVHATLAMPGTPFIIATDLGTDELVVYRFDPVDGTLSHHSLAKAAAGAGPRHIALSPDGTRLHAVNELDSTLATCSWDGTSGELRLKSAVSALPPGSEGPNSAAALRLDPSGRHALISHRGHDSISVLNLESDAPALVQSLASGGTKPRDIAFSPSGRWLFAANQDSDTIIAFSWHESAGTLTPTGVSVRIPSPVSLAFAPGQ